MPASTLLTAKQNTTQSINLFVSHSITWPYLLKIPSSSFSGYVTKKKETLISFCSWVFFVLAYSL